jgi:hypothetical protein
MDAVQNARLIANADNITESWYGSRIRICATSHMFETLKTLLSFYGPEEQGHHLGS